jgi:1-acyl-sn-glycerol-3-phosphate acyltransferase
MIEGLTRTERFNIAAVEAWHRVPPLSRLSVVGARFAVRPLLQATLGWMVEAHHFERLAALPRDRGLILCANHRSYLDNFVVGATAMEYLPWRTRYVVPGRTEGIFDAWYGLALNAAVGALNIYPPVVRSKRGHAWGQRVIGILRDLLLERRVTVLIHPEGGRNKGDDPYSLLPARPGLGRIIHESRATVVPIFLHGFPNSFGRYASVAAARLRGAPPPVQAVMGEPIDFSRELATPGSPTLFHGMAQRITAEISALMPEERALRASRGTTAPRG